MSDKIDRFNYIEFENDNNYLRNFMNDENIMNTKIKIEYNNSDKINKKISEILQKKNEAIHRYSCLST